MKIKHIDNVLTINENGFNFSKVLNLSVLIRISFLESSESAPCSILKNIFRNNLSINVNKTLIDFLKPNFLKLIDLTDTYLIMF